MSQLAIVGSSGQDRSHGSASTSLIASQTLKLRVKQHCYRASGIVRPNRFNEAR